jgi:lincosamide nucleotidyltransferase A/C/D/E
MTSGLGISSSRVVTLYRLLERAGIILWLDGGWGVDALLGRQTRDHSDVDIVVEEKNLSAVRALLAQEGFKDVPRDDTRAWNFLLANEWGEQVDVHVINLDAAHNGIYGPPENGDCYPASSLRGRGRVDGAFICCLTAEYQIESHRGYPLRDRDFKDMRALAREFGLDLPPEYTSSGG